MKTNNIKYSESEIKNYAKLAWLNTDESIKKEPLYVAPYEDLSNFNTSRLILDSLGKEALETIIQDSVDMLETSVAIYEKNGDYAAGNFLSGWCKTMNTASFNLCKTTDTQKALNCGKWICHDSCWNDISKPAIETGKITDLPCAGGLNIYAVPIYAFGNVIGAINFGWGDPPKDLKKLKGLSEQFKIPIETLQHNANKYNSRPKFILKIAKKHLEVLAEFIGNTVELKQTHKNLESSKIEAETANIAKSDFIANMSHEIRTPMNAVIGFSEQLINTLKDKKLRSKVKIIHSSGTNLLKIINDVLDISKIEAGKIELVNTPINLNLLADEIQNIFEHKTSKKKLSLTINSNNITTPYLLIDEVRLRQILFNLVSNAIKFTDEGKINIDFITKKTSNKKVILTITVEDTGIGIPKDQFHQIFSPFIQKRGQDVLKYGGTGLGLSIVSKFIEKMNGKIDVKSAIDNGSLFTVTIPNIPISSIDQVQKKPDFNINSIVFDEGQLLVVDDVKNNRKLIRGFFENSPKLKIIEATNENEAIILVKKHTPDLILVNINMLDTDGCEVTKRIREDLHTKNTPIIAITVNSENENCENEHLCKYEYCEKTLLFNGFINIPITAQELFHTIKKHLNHHFIGLKEPIPVPVDTEYKFTNEEAHLYPKILETLKTHFFGQYKKIKSSKIINDIENFGKELLEFSKEINSITLERYSIDICACADNFEMMELSSLLDIFPLLIEQLEQHQKQS